MGLLGFLQSIFHDTIFIIPPEQPISPDAIADVICTTAPTVAVFSSSMLGEIGISNCAQHTLRCLGYAFFGGASLAVNFGDRLCQLTNLVALFGAAETALVANMTPQKRESQKYYKWNPQYGVEMQFIGDDLYELVILRGSHGDFHGVFHIFSDLKECRTKDLFLPYPEKQNL